jgi:hypothetical protein
MYMEIMVILREWLDKWGLICYRGEDGTLDAGDCCANQFTVLYSAPHRSNDISRALLALTCNGIPIRHPDKLKWYSATNRTSRDQLTPYLLFTASPNKVLPGVVRTYFWRLLRQHAKHLFLFAWNTRRNFVYEDYIEHTKRSTPDVAWNYKWKMPDLCGPNIWCIYVRGVLNYAPILAPLLYPLLIMLDVYNFVGLIRLLIMLKYLGYKLGPTSQPGRIVSHDRRNFSLSTHFAAKYWPTIFSCHGWDLWAKYANEAAQSFWTQPGEPPVHKAISRLK